MTRVVHRHGRDIEIEDLHLPTTSALARKEDRHFGCPVPWLIHVLPAVKSAKQLTVAIYVWRRYVVCGRRQTFDIPNGELKRWGISRWVKYRTLVMLAAASIITMKQTGKETFSVTILPEKPRRKHK